MSEIDNEIDNEIERQKMRLAFAYQKRAEADDEIKEANHVIQSLRFASEQYKSKQDADKEQD